MNLLHVIGFGLKVGHILWLLCCWFLALISFNWLTNGGGIMISKASLLVNGGGDHNIWEQVSERGFKLCRLYSHLVSVSKVKKSFWKKALRVWIFLGISIAAAVLYLMHSHAAETRKETLANMCDERARMLQDQFNVSMNHIQAMSVMISIFHHGKNPSAIDQVFKSSHFENTTLYARYG